MKEYKRITRRTKLGNPYIDYSEIDLDALGVIRHFAELEDKIENGTLIELPCKVGDKVYYETFINNGSESVGIQPHEVKSIYTSIVTSNFSGYGYTTVDLDEFGKTVFLTENEAKLKEQQDK